jgi:hypothetical protein
LILAWSWAFDYWTIEPAYTDGSHLIETIDYWTGNQMFYTKWQQPFNVLDEIASKQCMAKIFNFRSRNRMVGLKCSKLNGHSIIGTSPVFRR